MERWFTEVLGRSAPPWLSELRAFLAATGAEVFDGTPRADDHPLFMPLADDGGTRLGLLVWPTPDAQAGVPVVAQRGRRLELVAGSAHELLLQRAASLDRDGRLDDAPERAAGGAYTVGTLAMTGLDLRTWTILRAGGSMEAYGSLIDRHLKRSDPVAALVAADRAVERAAGWAEPHVWRWRILSAIGRNEEARDAAVAALGLPVWTMRGDFAEVARAAGWVDPIDAGPFERLANDPNRPPADRAAWWMDHGAVDVQDPSAWSAYRSRIAPLYVDAGLAPIGAWVAWPITGTGTSPARR